MKEAVFTVEATPIVYGPGAAGETGFHLARLGVTKALIVSDPHVASLGITQLVREAIGERDIATDVFAKARVEPNESSMLEAIAFAREGGYDGFVGVGGGSSIDTAKVAALFATHGGELLDYVNKPIGEAKAPPGPLLPLAAVPTTAGTGSEATSVAIIDFRAARGKDGHLAPLHAPAGRRRRPLARTRYASRGHGLVWSRCCLPRRRIVHCKALRHSRQRRPG